MAGYIGDKHRLHELRSVDTVRLVNRSNTATLWTFCLQKDILNGFAASLPNEG